MPTGTIQSSLLNHNAITTRFKSYTPSITYLRNNFPAISYVFSETGSALKGSTKFQSYFGAALWSVDFQLYAMSKNVSRVSGTQRPVAKHSLWIPRARLSEPGPQVRAPFYAQPFVAGFIGKSAAGKRGVVNIDLRTPFVSAYAMFEGEVVKRVAIIGLREYTGSGQRNAVQVKLKGLSDSVRSARIGRLHANAGTDAGGFDVNGKNITWQGQQWSYKVDQGKGHGEMTRGSVNVTEGELTVRLPDSEAVIVYLND